MNRYAVTDMIKASQADMKLPTNGLKALRFTPCKSGSAPEKPRLERMIGVAHGRISHPAIRGFDSLHPLIASGRKYSTFSLERNAPTSTAGRERVGQFTLYSRIYSEAQP